MTRKTNDAVCHPVRGQRRDGSLRHRRSRLSTAVLALVCATLGAPWRNRSRPSVT